MPEIQDKCETRNRPIIAAVSPTNKLAVLFRPRCKLWSCPYCAEVNRKLWTVRAYAGSEALISEGWEMKFVTMTSHEKLEARQTWYVWPLAWKKLSTRIARAQGPGHQYLMVPEQHQDGRLHMHAIATWSINQGWLKDNARESGLGYMAEIEDLESPQHSAWYVAKYLGKQLTMLSWPAGWRHVRTSRGWPKMANQETHLWFFDSIGRESAQGRAERYRERGFAVLVLPHNLAWEIVNEFEQRSDP